MGRNRKDGSNPARDPQPADPGTGPGTAPPSGAAVGADSPEDLRAQAKAAAAGGSRAGLTAYKQRKALEVEAQQRAEQFEALKDLTRAIVPVPFETTAMLLQDPRWIEKLTDKRVETIADAQARMCQAWGLDFSSKWASLSLSGVVYARTFAMIFAEIAQEDAAKKAAQTIKPGGLAN